MMSKEKWDAAEWSCWSDEFIPTFLVCSSLRSTSACVGLSEHNAIIRSFLFPISLATPVSSQNEKLITMIKDVFFIKGNTR